MALTTGKTVEILFESAKESYEHQEQMLSITEFEKPDAGKMQNAGNIIWRPKQQHAPIIEGWDLAGQEQDIIEETYPSILGTPKNDFIKQRADDMRDQTFWERRGKQSGLQQATELNKTLATAISTQGSLFYNSASTSGYDFVAEGQALLNERQTYAMDRKFLLNDRDTLKFASDLAGRQTLQGRPDDTWKTGQIGSNIAEFDVFTGSYLPNLIGGASPDTTTTADVSEKPEGGSVNTATGVVTNIDCRMGTIPVVASAAYNIGDKISFDNGGATVKAIGLADKTDTGQAMTFTVVGKPDGTTLQIFPKPIALDDPALSVTEAAYANIDTQIITGAVVTRLNTAASSKTNLFWDKGAVEVLGGTIPAELFSQYDGMKVLSTTMSNGQELYMVYDGNIENMTFRYRIFTWYGVTVSCPEACGVALTV